MNGYGRSAFGYGVVPPVVKALLVVNAGVYLVGLAMPLDLAEIFGLVPASVLQRAFLWQLFSYMFLHGGLMHLVMNMFVLWMFGSDLEREWGSREFLRYYLICGVGGGVLNLLLQPRSPVPIIGASAAIYGILAAFAMIYPNRLIYLYFLVPIPAKYLVLALGVIEFILSTNRYSNVAHFAHLGGMLVGYLYLKLDWRLGAVSRWLKGRLASFRRGSQPKKPDDEKIMEQVDQILDKINREGFASLTRREKKILEEASQRLSRK